VLLIFGCADKETPETPRYLVTFDTDGGSPISAQTVVAGDAVVVPAIPSKDGAFFGGWFTDKAGKTPYAFSTPVTGPLTIYANWNGFENSEAVTAYLASAPGGHTAYDPIPLTVQLTDVSDKWANLLKTIEGSSRYVALDISKCTISGFGTVFEFDPDNSSSSGKSKIVSLVLPDSVISIAPSAFQFFTALRTVSGSGVKGIGDFAFSGRTSLVKADFPEAITIGTEAFYYTALETVSFPKVTTIGEKAFQWCNVVSASFPDVTTIGEGAFYDCRALETVYLTETEKTEIGAEAFYNCRALQEADFRHVTSIGGRAFFGCIALETVNFPEVAYIGTEAFYDCSTLKTVSFQDATTIGDYAFQYCYALETVNISSAETIGTEAFLDCKVLKTVSFPEATTIDVSAFSGCTALTTVNIPAVETIGSDAFAYTGNTPLTITLGSTVPMLDSEVFRPHVEGDLKKLITVRVPLSVREDYTAVWLSSFTGGNPSIDPKIETY
jgi:uncharacterized repeat protein (TIGR02543 family)